MTPKLPSYSHFKPRNQACVWLNRQRIYLGPYGSPESHARYAEIVRRLLAGEKVTEAPKLDSDGKPDRDGSPFTVEALTSRYSAYAAERYQKEGKPNAEAGLMALVLGRLAEDYGSLPAAEFGPLALKDFRQRLVARGLAKSSVNGAIARVRRAFRWAVADELLPAAVVTALEAVQGLRSGQGARDTEPVEAVDQGAVEATLPHLPEVVADMVRLQRLTGMRPGELCSLRPKDIDRSGDVWQYKPVDHKNAHRGKSRVVFIGPQGQAILLRYLARDPEACCFRPRDSEERRRALIHADRATPLSCGNAPGTNRVEQPKRAPGEQYTPQSYRVAVQRACRKAGVERWSPNQLRHATATAVRAEFGLDAAQTILGHSHAKTTEIYAERDQQRGEEIARKIG